MPRRLRARTQRLARRVARSALVRYVRRPLPVVPGDERRVTVLLSSAWGMGGTIRAAITMAGHLAASGWEVRIVSPYRRRDEPFFGSFPPGVEVVALDDQRPGQGPSGLAGFAYRSLRRRPSVVYPAWDRLSGDYSLWVDLRLARLLRRTPGIIVGTRPGHNVLLVQLALPGRTIIGLEQLNLLHHKPRDRRRFQASYGALDALVVLTEQDRDRYHALLDGRGRIEVIPNTVRPLGGPEPDPASRVAVAAGRFDPPGHKGFDLLLEAWAAVAERHPDWRLRIYGHGRNRVRLEAMRAALGLDDVVELRGATDDMGAAMGEASIYVLSSRTEGFPLILLEAMSKGLACVAFDCPTGPADVIDDHRTGLLVPAEDVAGLARAINEMIEDEELRRRCGAAAPAVAAAHTIEAIGPRWERLLTQVTGGIVAEPAPAGPVGVAD